MGLLGGGINDLLGVDTDSKVAVRAKFGQRILRDEVKFGSRVEIPVNAR